MDNLLKDLQYIKGVGPARKAQLARLGLETPLDMLWHLPRDYMEASGPEGIASIYQMAGQKVAVRAAVQSVSSRRTARRLEITRARLEDGSGTVDALWFNQPHLKKLLETGRQIFVSGLMKIDSYGAVINVSDYLLLDAGEDCETILPVYPLTEGMNQKNLRRIMKSVLDGMLTEYPEIIPAEIRTRLKLPGIQEAFREMHNPASQKALGLARRRLAFEEILVFKLALALQENSALNRPGICHSRDNNLACKLRDRLPFVLTSAQNRAIEEIFSDMESPRAMNRLLQGDVGSGKTAVAAMALAKAVGGGYQGTMMAPTEILARQHFQSLKDLFAGLEVNIALLAGSCGIQERRMIMGALAEGEIHILAGTHALIQDRVAFRKLGLAVIDEQHRFGVRQRSQLAEKGPDVDMLVMTATPIPRTLALSVYGEQNTSWLDEMPPGRKPVKTRLLPGRLEDQAYDFAVREVRLGRQAYVVCPLIEESEKIDLKNATEIYEKLGQRYPDISIGLLHGRMPVSEKQAAMRSFYEGQVQVLVATTVVEVGVDNPRATVMLVEQAERFGLAQLHQLRGRVGRGDTQSFCILIGRQVSDEAWQRLQAMEKTSNGFELAMADLQIRGPGDMMGWKQHGFSGFKVLNLARDQEIISACDRAIGDFDLTELSRNQLKKKYVLALGRYSAVL